MRSVIRLLMATAGYLLPCVASILTGGVLGFGIFTLTLIQYNSGRLCPTVDSNAITSALVGNALDLNEAAAAASKEQRWARLNRGIHVAASFLTSLLCIALISLQIIETVSLHSVSSDVAALLGVHHLRERTGIGVSVFTIAAIAAVITPLSATVCTPETAQMKRAERASSNLSTESSRRTIISLNAREDVAVRSPRRAQASPLAGHHSTKAASNMDYWGNVLLSWLIFMIVIVIAVLTPTVLAAPFYLLALWVTFAWSQSHIPAFTAQLFIMQPTLLVIIRIYTALALVLGFAFQISAADSASCAAGSIPVMLGVICNFSESSAWPLYLSYALTGCLHCIAGYASTRVAHADRSQGGASARGPGRAHVAGAGRDVGFDDDRSGETAALTPQSASQASFAAYTQRKPAVAGAPKGREGYGKLALAALAVVSSGFGFGAAAMIMLLWTTTYPSLLTFVPLAFVLFRGLMHTKGASYGTPPPLTKLLLIFATVLALAKYIIALLARFQFPSKFDPNATEYASQPYADDAVQAWYSDSLRVLGLFPAPIPQGEIALQLFAITALCIYSKTCHVHAELTPEIVLQDDLKASAVPLLSAEENDGERRQSVCSESEAPKWSDKLYGAVKDVLTFLQGYAALVALVVLYVLALSHVDLIHAMYLIFLVVFASFPHWRRRYWWFLVAFCALAISLMFIWDVLAFSLRKYRATITNVPSWVIGSDITNPDIDLWHSTYITNVAIFIFAVVQRPQYEKELDGTFAADLQRFYETHTWVAKVERWFRAIQLRYGVWIANMVFVGVALVPPVDLMSLTTLALTTAMVTSQLSTGIEQSATSISPLRRMSRMLMLMAAFQSIFLALRYIYQFGGIANLIDSLLQHISDVLLVQEFGLERYVNDNYTGSLYINLFDTVSVLVIAILQRRAVDSLIVELHAHEGTTTAVPTMIMNNGPAHGAARARVQRRETWAISAISLLASITFLAAGSTLFFATVYFFIILIFLSIMWMALLVQAYTHESLMNGIRSLSYEYWRGYFTYNSKHLLILCALIVALCLPDFMSAWYVVAFLLSALGSIVQAKIGCCRTRACTDSTWLWMWILSCLFFFAKYIYQFAFFGPSNAKWYSGGELASEWWGLYRMDHSAADRPGVLRTVDYDAVWKLLGPHISVMIFVCLARWAQESMLLHPYTENEADENTAFSDAAVALESIIPLYASNGLADDGDGLSAKELALLQEIVRPPHGRHVDLDIVSRSWPYSMLADVANKAANLLGRSPDTSAEHGANDIAAASARVGITSTKRIHFDPSQTTEAGNPAAALRATAMSILERRVAVDVVSGTRKVLLKYEAALSKDATIVSLLVAAAALLNGWSLVFFLFVLALFAPLPSESAQRWVWGKPAAPWLRALFSCSLSNVTWLLLSSAHAISLLVLYAACVGWLPSITEWQDLWPWNQPHDVQYFFGIGLNGFGIRQAGMGESGNTALLLPAFVAMIFASQAAGTAQTAPQVPIVVVESAPRYHIIDGDVSPAEVVVGAVGPRPFSLSAILGKHTAAASIAQSVPKQLFRSSWDTIQFLTLRTAPYIMLLVLFVTAATQRMQTVLSAGYMAYALFMLYAPDRLINAGNWGLIVLRVYNAGVLLAQLVYQMPFIPASTCATQSATGVACISWNAIIGLEKYEQPPFQCDLAANSTAITMTRDPGTCMNALSEGSSFISSFVLFIFATMLAYMFDSTAYVFVKAHTVYEKRMSASRYLLTQRQQLRALRESRRLQHEQAIIMQAKLDRLVHWVARMELVETPGANTRAHLNVWAPPQPQRLEVVQVAPNAVKLSWSPPEGYSLHQSQATPGTPLPKTDESLDFLSPKATYAALRARQQADDETVPSASTLRYVVLMNHVGSTIFGDFDRVVVTSKGVCEASVENLRQNELYEFQVAAINSVGIGTYTPVTLPIRIEEPEEGQIEAKAETDIDVGSSKGEQTAQDGTGNDDQNVTDGIARQPRRESVISLVMVGHEDARPCCGCADGFRGWVWWLVSGIEGWVECRIDRLLFHDAPRRWIDMEVENTHGSIWMVMYMRNLFGIFFYGVISHSQLLVTVSMIACALAYASAVSLVLPLYLFLHLMSEYPRPSARAWSFCLWFAIFVVGLKFIFQLPIFCLQTDAKDLWHPYLWYSCQSSGINAATALKYVQPIMLFGIYKYSPEYGGDGFMGGIFWDALVIAALLFHRAVLQWRGMWKSRERADPAVLQHALVAAGSLPAEAEQEVSAIFGTTPKVSVEQSLDFGTEDVRMVVATGLPKLDPDARGDYSNQGNSSGPEQPTFNCCPPASGTPNRAYTASNDWCSRLLRSCLPYGWYMSFIRVTSGTQAVNEKDGRDLYIYTFIIQFILLIVTIAAFGNITAYSGATESVSEQLAYNQFSGDMVLVVLAHICLMVLDRAAYLLRANWLKLFLQYVCVIAVHVSVFFVIPWKTGRPFIHNGGLVIFYLLWVCYFITGALQLCYGFSVAPPRDNLKSSGFGPLPVFAFNIYLSIPFLHELRQILDWVCTKTSLDLNQWMKLEAIHCNLFSVQADMIGRKRAHLTWSGRRAQGFCYKFWSGFCLFVALLLVILLPALIFSTLNPALSFNSVKSLQLQLNLRGASGSYELFSSSQLYALTASGDAIGQPDYFQQLQDNATVPGQPSPLNPDWDSLAQQAVLYTFPNYAWELSPPSLQNVQSMLEEAANSTNPGVFVDLAYAFTRPGPVGQQVTSATSSVVLSAADCATLADALSEALLPSAASTMLGSTIGQPLVLKNLYPLALRLPATANPVPLGSMMRTVQLVLHKGNNSVSGLETGDDVMPGAQLGAHPYSDTPLWWTLAIDDSDPFRWSTKTGLIFNTISDKVAPAVVQALGGYSILALYVTVVLAVGRLIRSGFGVNVSSIPYAELPDCTELIELCEVGFYCTAIELARYDTQPSPNILQGIRAAQRAKYDGHHIDEMHLYKVLLRLLRSPECLLRIAKAKDQ